MSEVGGPAPEEQRPRTSDRDPAELRRRLQDWLALKLPRGASPQVGPLESPSTNGMSSETLLFEARWDQDGARRRQGLVARLAPKESAVPVFPEYDLGRQFRLMRLVAELTSVPVPPVLWYEPDAGYVGSAFFVMERVDGQIPPDVMPYNLGSWLSEARPTDVARLQRSSVAVLAELHGIPEAESRFAFLACDRPAATGTQSPTRLATHVQSQRSYYEWAVSDGRRSRLIESCFAWLEARWPEAEGPAVLSWGDSRVGNIVYRDFEPVAVLDWEMASLAPREVDLAWMIYLHRFFEDIAAGIGFPGMPGFLRREEVVAQYESLTGYTPRDLDFYLMYAALRHGIVMSRVQRRAVHFGEASMPDDADDLILHRASLESMLAGTYWR